MTKGKYNRLMTNVKDYVVIVLALFIYALGFCAFILPHGIVIGGMAGLGTLVSFATHGLIPVAVTMYTVNITLIIMGYRLLGREFTIRTIFGASVASLAVGLMEGYFSTHPALIQDTAMSVVLGGILCGMGIGTTYIHNGTSGGSDIIAAMVTKVSNVSIGRMLMAVDMTIVALTFFLPFNGTVEQRVQACLPKIIYGWVTIFIYSYIADMLVNTNRQATQFIIFSRKWRQIADHINTEAHRGVTVMDGIGWYTKADVKVLMVWCRKIESVTIFRIIKMIDEDAFITQTNCNGVYGKGFDKMKIKLRKSHEEGKTPVNSPDKVTATNTIRRAQEEE